MEIIAETSKLFESSKFPKVKSKHLTKTPNKKCFYSIPVIYLRLPSYPSVVLISPSLWIMTVSPRQYVKEETNDRKWSFVSHPHYRPHIHLCFPKTALLNQHKHTEFMHYPRDPTTLALFSYMCHQIKTLSHFVVTVLRETENIGSVHSLYLTIAGKVEEA